MVQGSTVICGGKDKGIHMSGHGRQEDGKLMLARTCPRFFVQSMGMAAERMLVIDNGDVVQLTPEAIHRKPVQGWHCASGWRP